MMTMTGSIMIIVGLGVAPIILRINFVVVEMASTSYWPLLLLLAVEVVLTSLVWRRWWCWWWLLYLLMVDRVCNSEGGNDGVIMTSSLFCVFGPSSPEEFRAKTCQS
jgi:hypothetical protein